MDTLKLIKLSMVFDLTSYEVTRTEVEVTDVPPIDAQDVDDSWWLIKDGHYTGTGIPKWLHMGNLIRQYNPVQHYEALCPPEQEQETLKRMDGIVEAYVQNTAEQLRHLADQLEERYNYGYQTKRKPITV